MYCGFRNKQTLPVGRRSRPEARFIHPHPRDCDAMLFLKLLGRKRWPEIKEAAFTHKLQNVIADAGGD